ncbi:MAG TPA: histidinol dehydrogenase [Thermoanaerobaculia bacterium]
MIATFTIGTPAATEWLDALCARREQAFDSARDAAAKVAREVREGGDAAVASIVARVDGVKIAADALSIESRRWEIDPALSAAADLAIARIRSYHERQLAPERQRPGDEIVERVRPLRRVAVYVPGGRAVYLSTLIMGAVPALLAGVGEIVVLTTPAAAATPELGEIAARLGIRTIYRGGGAGIAAAAYGTASLPAVDKIVGPGSQFVTALKQYLYGRVGIDMTAGPSEVAVIADESAEPELVAADLLAQSEHGPDSAALAIAIGGAAPALRAAIERRMTQLPSDACARRSLETNGALAIARTAAEAVAFANALAPEHVSVQARDADAIAAAIENSGAIFVGRFSPVAIGDYTAGPNHILPTAGGGRFFSPLGVSDFLKSAHVVALSRETFAVAAPAAAILALREGLPLHAASIAAREGR